MEINTNRKNEIESYFKAIDELVKLCTESQTQIRHGQFRIGKAYLESVVNNATYLRDNIKNE